jgi:hypothetical protein
MVLLPALTLQPVLVPSYSYEAHVGSVTSVAVAGNILVSGGTDEMIK